MRRHLSIPIIAMLLTGVACLAQSGRQPAARILEVQGEVHIKDPAGKARAAGYYGTVYLEDQLTLAEGSLITLAFRADGRLERLSAAGEFRVTPQGCQPRKGVQLLRVSEPSQRYLRKTVGELGTMSQGGVVFLRGGDPSGGPPPVTPIVGATVLAASPVFRWPDIPRAEGYRVIIAQGETELGSWEAAAATLDTQGKIVLTRGAEYRWRVLARRGAELSRPIFQGEFRVAAAEQAAEADLLTQLAAAGDTPLLALAALRYVQLNLYEQAIAANEQLAATSPQESVFQAALFDLYLRAGRPEDAERAAERFKQLRPQPPQPD